MNKFEETLQQVQNSIKARITKDTPAEEVEKLGQLSTEVDKLGTLYKEEQEECSKMKDLYIKSINSYGTKELPSGEKTPRSLEEIAKAVVDKRTKK